MITSAERHPTQFLPVPGETPTWYRCPECGARLWMSEHLYVGGQGYSRRMLCSTCDHFERVQPGGTKYDVGAVLKMGNALDREQQWSCLEMLDEGFELDIAIQAIVETEYYREQSQECASLARGGM